jgi:hypothetical protein
VPASNTDDGLRAVRGSKPIDPDSVRRYLGDKFGDDLKAVRSAMQRLAKTYKPKELAHYLPLPGRGVQRQTALASIPARARHTYPSWGEPSRSTTKPHGGTMPSQVGKPPGTPQGLGDLRLGNIGGGRGKTEVAGETDRAPVGIPALAGAITNAAGAGGVHACTP